MQKFTDVFAETIPFLCKAAIAFALAFLIGGIAYCFAKQHAKRTNPTRGTCESQSTMA